MIKKKNNIKNKITGKAPLLLVVLGIALCVIGITTLKTNAANPVNGKGNGNGGSPIGGVLAYARVEASPDGSTATLDLNRSNSVLSFTATEDKYSHAFYCFTLSQNPHTINATLVTYTGYTKYPAVIGTPEFNTGFFGTVNSTACPVGTNAFLAIGTSSFTSGYFEFN